MVPGGALSAGPVGDGLGGPGWVRHVGFDEQVYETLAAQLQAGWRLVAGFLALCPPRVVGGFADPDGLARCLDGGTLGEVGA